MTDIAFACTVLGIAVDPGRLYDTEDMNYLNWLGALSDRVSEHRRKENEQLKR